MKNFKLHELPPPAKTLVFFFVLALLAGYAIALLQVYEHTHFDTQKIILEYRGSDNPDLMAFAKPYRELLQNTHAHALSIPVVYFLLSFIFLGTNLSLRKKSVLIALLFAGFFVDYTALWLLRYAHQNFVYLGFAANGVSGLAYLIMSGTTLLDLFKNP